MFLLGSSEIWSDKLKVYIIGTRSHGGNGGEADNITEVPTVQRATVPLLMWKSCILNPPFTPCLCVPLLKVLNAKGKP